MCSKACERLQGQANGCPRIQEEVVNVFIESQWAPKKASEFFRTFIGDILGLEMYSKNTLICVKYAPILDGLHMDVILSLDTI